MNSYCLGTASTARRVRSSIVPVVVFALLWLSTTGLSSARVLTDEDLARIASIKKLSVDVMTELAMLTRRPDLSQGDGDCVKATLGSLTQIAGELQSYEYLITIESQLNDVGDDRSVRSILRFAVENALKILDIERKHLGEIFEQCSRFPTSAEKARKATQFIETTVAILKSVQPRL